MAFSAKCVDATRFEWKRGYSPMTTRSVYAKFRHGQACMKTASVAEKRGRGGILDRNLCAPRYPIQREMLRGGLEDRLWLVLAIK